jgi:hypothetical protein
MKLMVIFILLIIITCDEYEWTDPVSNTYYNYEGLKRDVNKPWIVKKSSGIFSDVYYFNFGVKLNGICHKGGSNVAETMEVHEKPTPTCSLLGNSEGREVSLIDQSNPNKGIVVTYKNGDKCSTRDRMIMTKSTTFKLLCSPNQEENVFILNTVY